MLENFVIDGQTIAIFGACIAIGFMAMVLWLRRDDASEKRHSDYIDISNIASEGGYELFAEFMKCAALTDVDGMYAVAVKGKALLLNDDLRNAHFKKIFERSLQNPAYTDLIIQRASEIEAKRVYDEGLKRKEVENAKKLEAVELVDTVDSVQKVERVVVTKAPKVKATE